VFSLRRYILLLSNITHGITDRLLTLHQVEQPATWELNLSNHNRGLGVSAESSLTATPHGHSHQLLPNGGPGARSETACSRGIHQHLYGIANFLARLTAAVFQSGYMILDTLLDLRDSIKRLAKALKKQSSSVSLASKSPGWNCIFLLAIFPLCVATKSTGDVSGRSSLLTVLPNGAHYGTGQLPHPDDPLDLWIMVGCFTMITVGGLYMAWRWWYTTASLPLLGLMGTLAITASASWTAVAFTVEGSDNRRYLGLAGWCMFAMAFLSEPLLGVSPMNRRSLSHFDIAGPAACIFFIRLLSGDVNLEAMKFLSGGFTLWWIMLRIIFYHSRETQSTDEENGDEGNDAGIGMDTFADQAAAVDGVEDVPVTNDQVTAAAANDQTAANE
jgi:hypothetical protein